MFEKMENKDFIFTRIFGLKILKYNSSYKMNFEETFLENFLKF